MEEKSAQVKLGVMVFVALIILIGGIIWGKSIKISRSYYPKEAFFENVTGLEKGARVLVNGISKGRVAHYSITKGGVNVILELDEDIVLYNDAYAYLESPDLMADRVVAIYPGKSGVALPDSVRLEGLPQYNYSQLFAAVGDIKDELSVTLKTLNMTAESLYDFISMPGLKEEFNSTLISLSSAANTLDNMLVSNQGRIDSAAANLLNISNSVISILDKHGEDIEIVFEDVKNFTGELQQISDAAIILKKILKNRESTLGRLMYDDDFYKELHTVMMNLDSLLTEFRESGVKTRVRLF